ncbi:MAG: hypothetical protein JXL97_09915, partial [Bacteroidales bacterium]|nr:hypothetical protein [Bacteroidales bacterium]
MNDIFIQDVSKEKDLTPEETHMLYLDSHTKTIKKHLGAVAESFIAIGFYLYEVRIYNYYEPKFKDVLEYAEDTFGLSKTSTYNFIALCEKFSKRTQRNTPYMYIDEKWKGY